MKEEEEKIKEAMTEALIHLEGCKYFCGHDSKRRRM